MSSVTPTANPLATLVAVETQKTPPPPPTPFYKSTLGITLISVGGCIFLIIIVYFLFLRKSNSSVDYASVPTEFFETTEF